MLEEAAPRGCARRRSRVVPRDRDVRASRPDSVDVGRGARFSYLEVVRMAKSWEEINRVYADFFGPVHPARSIITVAGLHHGCLVEIEAVAYTL